MRAILTIEWNEVLDRAPGAAEIYEDVAQENRVDLDRLRTCLENVPKPLTITGLDALFRRSSVGFDPIKRFVGALTEVSRGLGPITCRINAITYAFLKGAKNFDLILPEDRTESPFRQALPDWRAQITSLEAFERDGNVPSDVWLHEPYVGLRPVMARPSARDEQRSLAALLLSGPSTLDEIRQDLGMSYDLSQRVVAPFVSRGVVDPPDDDGRYVITERALPLVLFLLRETMGINPLEALAD